MHRFPASLFAVLLPLLGACAASHPVAEGTPAPPAPVPAGELPPGPAVVRHNPPRCPCSPWEVRFPDHWERVHVDDRSRDGDLMARLAIEAEAAEREDRDATWEVVAELRDEQRTDHSGHRHRVLRVAGLPEPEEPEEPEDGGDPDDAAEGDVPAPPTGEEPAER